MVAKLKRGEIDRRAPPGVELVELVAYFDTIQKAVNQFIVKHLQTKYEGEKHLTTTEGDHIACTKK